MRAAWRSLRPGVKAAITMVVLASTATIWVPVVIDVVVIAAWLFIPLLILGACWGLLTALYTVKEAK